MTSYACLYETLDKIKIFIIIVIQLDISNPEESIERKNKYSLWMEMEKWR